MRSSHLIHFSRVGIPTIAVPPQKMPFKMKLGIMAGRVKREEKETQAAKDSGTILAKVAGYKVGGRQERDGRGRGGGRRPGGPRRDGKEESQSFDVKTKGGVLHLSKKRLPGKLSQKAFGR